MIDIKAPTCISSFETQVKAELKQARAKLSDTKETCSSLSAQWEKSQQKVKELEQELLRCSQADKLQSSLQEKLAQEKSKVGEAQKKVSRQCELRSPEIRF